MRWRSTRRWLGALGLALGLSGAARAALDIDALWDFADPAASEQRFRAAIAGGAGGDDALILRTQIARSYGLRQHFDEAHRELDAITTALAVAGPAPRVHASLERGRSWRAAGRADEARPHFQRAFDEADRARLEFLAADALHMLALVAPDLDASIALNRRVIAYAQNAADPRARRWEAAALNNIGVGLNQAGRHVEALVELQAALAAYRRHGRAHNVRMARWMVAHTLRRLGRLDEALEMQHALQAEHAAAGGHDPFVFAELAEIHRARGDPDREAYYRALAQRAR